jgi:hypothetical protein
MMLSTLAISAAATLSACGTAPTTATPSSPTTRVITSTPIAGTATPAVAVTAAEAIAVAQSTYRPAPTGGTCDDRGPKGAGHFASCPFASALAAQFANEAPDGTFTAAAPCRASCTLPLLCLCQSGPVTYSGYAAAAAPGGWMVTVAGDLGSGQQFILDVSAISGVPLVTDIRYRVNGGCTREIDGGSC